MAARQQTVDKEPSPLAPVPQVGQRDADASGSRVPLPRRPRLADYVARYPLLGPVEQLPNDLIVNEYYARRRYGDRPTHAEYLDAFGSRHPDLAKQLQAIDDGMAAAEHLPPDLVSENGLPPGTTAQQFGEYVLLEKLGEGGMGVVHKARHRRMKRLVAVKMIAKREVGSPDAVKRFYREVETAAKLEHPNIVTAYDAGEHEGLQYLVMQYVEGKDLAAIVQERGPLPIAEAVDYVIQAARGLQYAHKHQIIHRDIKPSNLLLDKEGTVKILDMGLASIAGLADDPARDRLTGSGQLMGTCDYMAPEQALDAHHADARADIYSLGCTLYRLLTGRVLYKGESLIQVLLAHRESPIPSLCQARPDVPPQLDAAYQKMVAKRPEDRWQSMTEVIADLETCAGIRGAAAASAGEDATAALPMRHTETGRRGEEERGRRGEEEPVGEESPAALPMADNPALLQGVSPGGAATAARKPAQRLAEATLSQQAPAAETSKHLARDAKLLAVVRKKKTLALGIALGLLAVAAVIVWAVMISIRTSSGMLEIETNDPNVHVAVKQNGELVEVVDAKSGWKISLKSGQYELAPQGSTDQFQLDRNSVTVRRGETSVVKVTLNRESSMSHSKSEISNSPADRERRAAEWVLRLGGGVTISVNGKEAKVETPEDLPNEQFVVVEIRLNANKAVTSESLENLAGLTSLRGLGLEDTKAAGSGLQYLKGLKGLNWLTLTGASDDQLANLSELTELRALWLRNTTQVTDAGLDHLKRLNQLESLDLAGTSVTGTGLATLSGLRNLKFLALTGGQVTDDSVRGLRSLKTLEKLWLRGTSITGLGLEHLSQLDNLADLGLADAPLTGPGLEHLKVLKKLRALDLYNTRLTSEGLKHLQGFTDLQNLNLACTKVTDVGMKELENLSNLRRLALGHTLITDAALIHLTRLSQLEYLDLSETAVTDPAVKELQKSLPMLKIGVSSADAADKPRGGSAKKPGAEVPSEPIVPAKPVRLDLKPDAKAWDLKPGSPLNPASLVLKPAAIKGLRSWTVEVCASRRGWPCGAGEVSPDDQLYATGSHDGVIRFLDPANGKLRIALVNPELDITAITWSPDNAYVAVGCANGVVRIWNVAEGALVIGPASTSTNQINSLAWSPDGALLSIAQNGESAVVLWDVREARQRAFLEEQADVNRSVHFLAWSMDGKQLMAATDLAVRIWDVAEARLIQTLDPQSPQDQAGRCAAAWSPDGKRIATLCDDGKVKVFDSTYKRVLSGSIRAPVFPYVAWSSDSLHLAGAWFNGCHVLNAHSGLSEFSTDGLEWGIWGDGCTSLSWLHGGSRLLCCNRSSGTVTAMDALSGKPLWKLVGKLAVVRDGTGICISPDRRQYATAGDHDRLYTWDAIKGAPAQDYGPVFPARGQVSWSTDGRLAVAGNGAWGAPGDPGARIWDAGQPGMAHVFNDSGYRCAAWSPDGKILARGGADVLLWTSDPDDPHKVFHPDAEVAKLAWGANNSTLAAGLDNNKVVILEMPSGKVLKTLTREGLDGGIRYLAVVADGRLVAASGNGAVSVWNAKWETVGDLVRLKKTVRQGSDLVRVEINVNDGTMPAPSGGTTIAFATSDGIVLWDADKQAIQKKVGAGPIYSVAWSVPVHRLIAAQEDRIAIYDEPTGELLASQLIWYGPGKHLFLSPEGHMRCSPAMSEDVVYVALTDEGRQVTLRPAEFAAKYGWKNDPEKIRLSSAAAK